MSLDTWMLFLLAYLLATLTPGPNVLLVVKNGLQLGWRPALLTIGANLFCQGILIFLVAMGVGALLQTLPPRTELEVHGAELAEVFHLLAACDGSVVSLEAVEDLFHQLAAHTSGSPVAWRHAASPDTVALGLVMLRETMHHGGFRSVFWLLQVE